MINRLLVYFNTIRYLKPKQIFFQVWYRLYSPSITNGKFDFQQYPLKWNNSSWRSTENLDSLFEFLGIEVDLLEKHTWSNTNQSLLWRYNLHYLDCLNDFHHSRYERLGLEILEFWYLNNPIGKSVAWDPYPISIRLVNSVKFLSTLGNQAKPELINSLGDQATYLAKTIEYHIMANHLFANGKALLFAGCYLKNSELFFNKGFEIISSEIEEQFLADGAHFELSPMYHALLMWDLADLIQLSNITQNKDLLELKPRLVDKLSNGITWLEHMTHPDGNISFFNDACLENAPNLHQLRDYVKQIGITLPEKETKRIYKGESGYTIIELPNENGKLIADMANVGASYQPGHAHADTLSFEFSLFGQRVFVNSGTSEYGISEARSFQRSTEAHNTIVIDGKNSSEIWSGFRVGNRASVNQIEYNIKKTILFSAHHNGYRTVNNDCLHKRSFEVDEQMKQLEITDELSGYFRNAYAYFYLHPEIRFQKLSNGLYSLILKNGKKIFFEVSNHNLEIEKAQWHYAFGKQAENIRFKIPVNDNKLRTLITWGEQ